MTFDPEEKHVMLDTETYGTRPGCVLRSVGIVGFTLSGKIGGGWYSNITRESCEAVGLCVNPETERWWGRQSEEAQAPLLQNQQPLGDVVNKMHHLFRQSGALFIWSQGSSFDVPIWEAACDALGVPAPWKFWNIRDTRTIYHLGRLDPRDVQREGVAHHALDDAKYQVKCVQAAARNLFGVRSIPA